MHLFLALTAGDEQALIRVKDELMKQNLLVMGQSALIKGERAWHQVVEARTTLDVSEVRAACLAVKAELQADFEGELELRALLELLPGEVARSSQKSPVNVSFGGQPVNVAPESLLMSHPSWLEAMCDLAPDFVHPQYEKSMKILFSEA